MSLSQDSRARLVNAELARHLPDFPPRTTINGTYGDACLTGVTKPSAAATAPKVWTLFTFNVGLRKKVEIRCIWGYLILYEDARTQGLPR